MRVAFYGRYSSDNQRDTSIEDQHRVVRRWAETHGYELVAEFSDAAISGANIRLLPIGLIPNDPIRSMAA